MSQEKKRLRRIQSLNLGITDSFVPDVDEEVRILAGRISHIGGTLSRLELRDGVSAEIQAVFCRIDAATCAISLDINPTTATSTYNEENVTDSTKVPFNCKYKLVFLGGTGATLRLILEVVKVDPETGARLA